MDKDIGYGIMNTNQHITENSFLENADNTVLLERREAKQEGVPLFASHWHIFIPSIVILTVYSVAWVMMTATGNSETHLARLFIVVMAVAVPLLAAHAFLRYQTIRVQVSDGHVFCHSGWPKEFPVDVPLSIISKVEVKRGLFGRVFNAGTLVLHLVPQGSLSVADLGQPFAAKQAIEEAIAEQSSL
ncbi:MAG: PH domain-containing protein [Pseudomonadota bacterium]